VTHEHRREHLKADCEQLRRHAVARLHLGDHVVLPFRLIVASVLRRPRPAGQAGVIELSLPVTSRAKGHPLGLLVLTHGSCRDDMDRGEVSRAALPRRVFGEPALHLRYERVMWTRWTFNVEADSGGADPAGGPRSRDQPAQPSERGRSRRRRHASGLAESWRRTRAVRRTDLRSEVRWFERVQRKRPRSRLPSTSLSATIAVCTHFRDGAVILVPRRTASSGLIAAPVWSGALVIIGGSA